MSKSAKPIAINSSHLTKEEIEDRKEQEEKLQGNDDLVYTPPRDLKTKTEKELYVYLVEQLKASAILNNLDIQILVQTVDSIMNMRAAKKAIKKYGMVIEKDDGGLQKNPAITIYKDYSTIFYQCCLQLGLSPSARAKLSVINVKTKENEKDPLLKALRGED
jgi:P27 family predicted phage terminase small subunit